MRSKSDRLHFQAVSNIYGRITQLLVAFRGDADNVKAQRLERAYKAFSKAFDDRVTFVILARMHGDDKNLSVEALRAAQSPLDEVVRDARLTSGRHIIYVDAPLADDCIEDRHGFWIQDCFVVAERDTSPVLVEPILCQHNHMRKVAEQVGTVADILIKPTHLLFDGGNILIGNDYALVGRDELVRNWAEQERAVLQRRPDLASTPDQLKLFVEGEIEAAFRELLGVSSLIWIGSKEKLDLPEAWRSRKPGHQPFFHLDLFATLAGFQKGEEKVLIANFELDEDHIKGDWKPWEGELLRLKQSLEGIADYLGNEVVNQRRCPAFDVGRIPIGLEVSEEGITAFSYNNGLAEYYNNFSKFYMPMYEGWEELGKRARQAVAGHFDRLVEIEWDFDLHARAHGALNCMTKVLQRR